MVQLLTTSGSPGRFTDTDSVEEPVGADDEITPMVLKVPVDEVVVGATDPTVLGENVKVAGELPGRPVPVIVMVDPRAAVLGQVILALEYGIGAAEPTRGMVATKPSTTAAAATRIEVLVFAMFPSLLIVRTSVVVVKRRKGTSVCSRPYSQFANASTQMK